MTKHLLEEFIVIELKLHVLIEPVLLCLDGSIDVFLRGLLLGWLDSFDLSITILLVSGLLDHNSHFLWGHIELNY